MTGFGLSERYYPDTNRVVARLFGFSIEYRRGETAMIRADYLVATVPRTDAAEASYPVMMAYWLPDPQPFAMYGYRGYKSGRIFW